MHDQPNWPEPIAGRIFPGDATFSLQHDNAYRMALELAPCPILVSSMEGLTLDWGNPAAANFLQVPREDLPEFVLADFVPEPELPVFWQSMSELQKGKRSSASTLLSADDGIGICRLELAVNREHLIAIGQNASTGNETVAATDALTGLPDRRVLLPKITAAIARKHLNWGLLFIDLNDFKQINDRYGHVVGDQVLTDFARNLRASSRPQDLVIRYGGDEFVILVDRVPSKQDLQTMAERIGREVTGTTANARLATRVTCSVGCAMADANHKTTDDIISAADRDMYYRKQSKPV